MADVKHVSIDGTSYDVRDDSKISSSLKGAANGVAELDSTGKVPSSQLPEISSITMSVVGKSLVFSSSGGES